MGIITELILFVCFVFLGQSEKAKTCPHPAVPIYASIVLSNKDLSVGTTVTYSCDEGYELFGESARACLPTGKWSGEIPNCGGHQTCLSINRLWHELCDMLRRLVGTTAPGQHDCSIQE
ncbi:CUB and sushi domain-containing protein 1 [Trichonephila clavipes]|nr:CUB and sushi domain-containing protein 1 [Trichonephila clavipes]